MLSWHSMRKRLTSRASARQGFKAFLQLVVIILLTQLRQLRLQLVWNVRTQISTAKHNTHGFTAAGRRTWSALQILTCIARSYWLTYIYIYIYRRVWLRCCSSSTRLLTKIDTTWTWEICYCCPTGLPGLMSILLCFTNWQGRITWIRLQTGRRHHHGHDWLQIAREPKASSLMKVISAGVSKHVQDPLALPVDLLEPTTNLMLRAEDLHYSELLDQVWVCISIACPSFKT